MGKKSEQLSYLDFLDALDKCKSGSDEEFEIYKGLVEYLESESEINELKETLISDEGRIICPYTEDVKYEDDMKFHIFPAFLDDIAAPFDNLAVMYMDRNDYENAFLLLQKALPLYRAMEIYNPALTYQRYYATLRLVECLHKMGNEKLALYYEYEMKYLKCDVLEEREYRNIRRLLLYLKKKGITPFIGYGNPNADILIVGKECAHVEGDENYDKFYKSNFEHWYETVFCGHKCTYKSGEEPYDFEHGNFHPINPFYKLENKKQSSKKEIGRPSATYYYYQRLIDKIRACRSGKGCGKSEIIDFFSDCFITELSDKCRPNNKNISKSDRIATEESIRNRFDWMRETDFFRQFKVVILACGPSYAKRIMEDETLRLQLFGNAQVFYCNQLSRWDKTLDKKIPEIQKVLYEGLYS